MSFLEQMVKDVRERIRNELGKHVPERKDFGKRRSLKRSILDCKRAS